MSTFKIHFSPTGGTKRVINILSNEWYGLGEIDLTDASVNFGKYYMRRNDLCLIGVPSYGGRVPDIALQRLRKIHNNGAMAVIVVVYGNRAYDDTMLELKNELEACGFRVKAGIAAVAEHSIMHRFGAGRPDKKDAAKLQQFAWKIQEMLEDEEYERKHGREPEETALEVPGEEPYKEYVGVPIKPKAGRKCDGCKVCVKKCPVRAISEEDPKITDLDKCISCMRCVAVCPRKARKASWLKVFFATVKMSKVCGGRKANQLFL